MCLDHGSIDVNTHQPRVAPDPGRTSQEGVGHGVQGLTEVDVVVGVDLVLAPVGGVKALTLEGEQVLSLDVLEDGQGLLPGGGNEPSTSTANVISLLAPGDSVSVNQNWTLVISLAETGSVVVQVVPPSVE